MPFLILKLFLCIVVEERRRTKHFWFDVSTSPLRPIYTEEAYKQDHLIGRHEESYHLIFQMLSAKIWHKASNYNSKVVSCLVHI
jgi:hypothetical protein